jgi:hypothetical protein
VLGSACLLILAVISLTGRVLWPVWQEHRAGEMLAHAIEDHNSEVAGECVQTIRRLGQCTTTLDRLAPLIDNPDPNVHIPALNWLFAICVPADDEGATTPDPRFRSAVRLLQRTLRHADPWMRWQAAEGLSCFAADAGQAVPDLIPLLRDDDTRVRAGAANALGRIGQAATEAVPALRAALADNSSYQWKDTLRAKSGTVTVSAAAAEALRRIDSRAAPEARVP